MENETTATETKTRRHLVPKAALAFPYVRDDEGHITDLGEPDVILDTDELLTKVLDATYAQSHKIVVLNTTVFYK